MKGKCYVFSGYKQRIQVLECKLKEDRYSWCIFKLKLQKTVDKTYLEPTKQQQGTANVFRC